MSECQRRALRHVRVRARAWEPVSRRRLAGMLDGSGHTATDLIELVRNRGRITVHFHPDRLLVGGRSVVEQLLDEGVYRSQFETRISNGGLTAHPGGDRDRWEGHFFGEAYTGAPARDRPKYGAFDTIGCSNGAAPRFGSCHLRLAPTALERSTLSVGDSVSLPTVWGSAGVLAPVVAELIAQMASGHGDAGVAERIDAFVDAAAGERNRELDAYIEAQFHDELDLAGSVEAIVIDESFLDTPTWASMEQLAHRNGCSFETTPGFRLAADVVPPSLRGPEAAALALRVVSEFGDGHELDAAVIGRAAASIAGDPDRWSGADPAELLQQVKYLWHALVLLG